MLWKAVSSHLSYDQKLVSDIDCVKALITSFPMNNSKWVALHILWRQFYHIFSYIQQFVSDIAHFTKSISFHLFSWPTASKYIGHFVSSHFPYYQQFVRTLHMLWKTVLSHHFLSPTGSGWHCTFCTRQSRLITSFPINNSMWIMALLWKAFSESHLFLWQTACMSHCRFCERQSDHIFSYYQQEVSDIWHFMKAGLITSFPMINSKWVTLDIL